MNQMTVSRDELFVQMDGKGIGCAGASAKAEMFEKVEVLAKEPVAQGDHQEWSDFDEDINEYDTEQVGKEAAYKNDDSSEGDAAPAESVTTITN